MEHAEWDAVVIGGGVAGLSAALMLGRARRRTLVIDGGAPRNRFAAHMHGVLGNDGTPPEELLARGRAEIERYGVRIVSGSVESVEDDPAGLAVTIAGRGAVSTRAVLVATGLTDELADVPGLAEYWGRGVLHCPYCHGWEVRDRVLGVILSSELGLHQTELVRQWSDEVIVFTSAIGSLRPEVEKRLRARGMRIIAEPVAEVIGDGTDVTAVRLSNGEDIPVGAVFTTGAARPHDGFLSSLSLDRTEAPAGSFLAIDPMGRTSDSRIWAAGNVVAPAASVPMAMGAGTAAGASVNATLVAEDFDAAERDARAMHEEPSPVEFWENRYSDAAKVWSGHPNKALTDVVAALIPGRALDLGCGEGADVIWLAENGWHATGVDISTTAVARATAMVEGSPVAERARFIAADLATWDAAESYDLVTASFLQSPVALDRAAILRRAAARVTPGGHLLLTAHATAPNHNHAHAHAVFPTPEEELATLDLDPASWRTVIAETRRRTAVRDGAPVDFEDSVVLLQRIDAAPGSATA
ncbi:hypothetical protein ASD65_07100 [Microbacterium sp. Root61]|uniref:bifunctional NAD(P)/FAD-dependent oxidoreductase/class I SAM-dependent methyltransferase n=1 Tax=Microbacterium sp. Root61 TaxID=1736570 RepID=UPI0006FF80F0|nr:bifunctional NAD(P)/FAD-dependent oxidoreductase/class I SAM-dependent methyltransferase [Microbacterium sp. Root61]KRA24212.1 hypothetical protein ASD65_07100 [Microbacterium sp. Root61]